METVYTSLMFHAAFTALLFTELYIEMYEKFRPEMSFKAYKSDYLCHITFTVHVYICLSCQAARMVPPTK